MIVIFTYKKTVAVTFLEAFEVIPVSLTSSINEPLTSSCAFVVKIPDEITSAGSCVFRQVTHRCQID